MFCRGVCAALLVSLACGCVRDNLVTCSDGTLCAPDQTCISDPALPRTMCAGAVDKAPCDGHENATACELGGAPGTCYGGTCITQLCGDKILDATEACDDGNTLNDDGCSADCRSREQCGDGDVDPRLGEQCDDHVAGRSSDGCSSTCLIELPTWDKLGIYRPTAYYSAALATTNKGVLYYGGRTTTGATGLDETWLIDGVSWVRREPAKHPPPLISPSAATDPDGEHVYLFGGQTDNGPSDQTWIWDGIQWSQVVTPVHPSARNSAAFACSPAHCILFGGADDNGALGDTWEWLPATRTWARIVPDRDPEPRASAGLTYDVNGDFVMLDGNVANEPDHHLETLSFDTTAQQWTWTMLTPPAFLPAGGSGRAASAYYDPIAHISTFVHAGGVARWDGSTWSGEDHEFTTLEVTAAWNPRTGTGLAYLGFGIAPIQSNFVLNSVTLKQPLFTRDFSDVTWDAARGVAVYHDTSDGQTWEWTADGFGPGWTLRATRSVPDTVMPLGPRVALAWHRACGVTIGVGASYTTEPLETWTWDGTTWTQLAPATAPSPRTGTAVAYDAAHDAIVLFGGYDDAGAPLGDTWTLSGPCDALTWTQAATTGPPARGETVLSSDDTSGTVLLFGGTEGTRGFDDTWTWNGTSWTQQTAVGPRARLGAAMTFDRNLQQVLLYGGHGADLKNFSDLWRWDGAQWLSVDTLLAVDVSNGPRSTLIQDRSGHVMTFDPYGTVWRLEWKRLGEADERCQLATDDLDADNLAGCADPDCRVRCAPECPSDLTFDQCTGPRCGDGTCSALEDAYLCPQDCP